MQVIKKQYKKATATRKGRIIFFSILFLLVAGIAGAVLYWQYNKKWIIRKKMEAAIREKTKGLYKIVYDDLELDEINGFLSITNLRIEYDSFRLAAMGKDVPSTVL